MHLSSMVYFSACDAISAALAAPKFFTSPCLPFCTYYQHLPFALLFNLTHLPLCESQVHLSTALRLYTGVLLQRATNDTGRHCEVSVVAGSCQSPVVQLRVDTYVKPAAFHPAAILTACKASLGVVESVVGGCSASRELPVAWVEVQSTSLKAWRRAKAIDQ